jgi:hypothetical protein
MNMDDLGYVIWFLLNEKRFEVEFRTTRIQDNPMEVTLRYFDANKKLYRFCRINHKKQKLHQFVLLTAMSFEAELNSMGIK